MGGYYDLLVYHDFGDTFDEPLAIGDDAAKIGFPGLRVVALGPAIHEGKDATLVLSHGARPMREVQRLLERPHAHQ